MTEQPGLKPGPWPQNLAVKVSGRGLLRPVFRYPDVDEVVDSSLEKWILSSNLTPKH